MSDIKIGDMVQVVSSDQFNGLIGKVTKVHPTGTYADFTLYQIKYLIGNSGQFKREELLKMEDIL